MRISPDDMRPCNHAYRIVTYRIGDMRAVMIEGPSREAIEPIGLGSCAVCQLIGQMVRNVTVLCLSGLGPSNHGPQLTMT